MKKCIICGNRKDIYDLTLQRCFDCRHKIDERKEMEKINQTIKDFEERKNMEYKISNCDIPMPQGFGEQKGWICPVCGRGVAPWVDYCPCQGSEMKITYGTSTATDNEELNRLFELNNKRVDEMISFQEKYGG